MKHLQNAFKICAILPLLFIFSECTTSCLGEIVDPPVLIPAQYPCQDGYADIYPCSGYDLMAHVPIDLLGGVGTEGNDSWGWTDPLTGNEYVLIGTSSGTAFLDITNAVNPVLLGRLPTATTNSIWRDIKVYENHAFIVSEASDHGMQVFDLTKLRYDTVPEEPETYTADAHYTAFGNAHNIVINEQSGFAYVVGTTTFNGGPHFVNIQNPLNPIPAGGYATDAYSHDAQVITYDGPDNDYVGREILIGSNENEVVIVDVTNKANPVNIAAIGYSNIEYTHQGWFTEDRKYFLVGDELDEYSLGNNTRTLVFDFTDLDNPLLHQEYFGETEAIDHNLYVKDDTCYLANYSAGVRMFDISDIENTTITPAGYFDTYPENDTANFNGVWNVYPYFESGNIVVSDIDRGLFIIRKTPQ